MQSKKQRVVAGSSSRPKRSSTPKPQSSDARKPAGSPLPDVPLPALPLPSGSEEPLVAPPAATTLSSARSPTGAQAVEAMSEVSAPQSLLLGDSDVMQPPPSSSQQQQQQPGPDAQLVQDPAEQQQPRELPAQLLEEATLRQAVLDPPLTGGLAQSGAGSGTRIAGLGDAAPALPAGYGAALDLSSVSNDFGHGGRHSLFPAAGAVGASSAGLTLLPSPVAAFGHTGHTLNYAGFAVDGRSHQPGNASLVPPSSSSFQPNSGGSFLGFPPQQAAAVPHGPSQHQLPAAAAAMLFSRAVAGRPEQYSAVPRAGQYNSTARRYFKYHVARLQTAASHILFYAVTHDGMATLAVVVSEVASSQSVEMISCDTSASGAEPPSLKRPHSGAFIFALMAIHIPCLPPHTSHTHTQPNANPLS